MKILIYARIEVNAKIFSDELYNNLTIYFDSIKDLTLDNYYTKEDIEKNNLCVCNFVYVCELKERKEVSEIYKDIKLQYGDKDIFFMCEILDGSIQINM